MIAVPAHQADDRRGIDATGQEGPERHVADHADADGLVQLFEKGADRVRGRLRGRAYVAIRWYVPVPFPEAALFPDGAAAGLQLADTLEEGTRAGHVTVGEVVPERAAIRPFHKARV